MPSNFTRSLNGPSNPASAPDRYTGDASGAAAGIAKLAEIGGAMQDQRILSKYNSDVSQVEDAAAGYQGTMDELIRKEYNASAQNDKVAVTEFQSQIQKLRSGELNGVISPTAANIRLQMLTKEWATRYPHLTSDFKKLYTERASNMPKSSGSSEDVDPTTKGMHELMQRAAKEGRTVASVLKEEEETRTLAELDRRNKIKMALGEDAKPGFEQMTNTMGRLATEAIVRGMEIDYKRGTLDKGNWSLQIEESMNEVTRQFQQMFSDYEMESGNRLDPQWKQQTINNALSEMNGLKEAAKTADSLDKKKRLLDYARAEGEETEAQWLRKTWGLAGAAVIKYPNMGKALVYLAKYNEAVAKGGTTRQIYERLNKDNPEAAIAFQLMGTEKWRDISAAHASWLAVAGVENAPNAPTAPPAGLSPTQRRALAAQSEELLGQAGMPDPVRERAVIDVAQNAPERLTKNQNIVRELRNMPGLLDKVKDIFATTLVGAADNMDPHEFDYLEMGNDPAKPAVNAKPTPVPESDSKATGALGSITDTTFVYPVQVLDAQLPNVKDMADRLNRYYEVLVAGGINPNEARQEVGKALVGLIDDRTASAQKPTKKQQAEKAEAEKPAVTVNPAPAPKLERLRPGPYRDAETGEVFNVGTDGTITKVTQ